MQILQYPLEEVPELLANASVTLQKATWPDAIWEPEEGEEIPAYLEKRAGTLAFLAMTDRLLGYAEIFPRTIYGAEGAINIWGLASVCVSAESQGLGIGRKIIEACFETVQAQPSGICLFQTMVPGFYEKLNCRLIDNRIVNKTDPNKPEENPFWDDHVMIYPRDAQWPTGTIDLNGRGY